MYENDNRYNNYNNYNRYNRYNRYVRYLLIYKLSAVIVLQKWWKKMLRNKKFLTDCEKRGLDR
jgi:hypothetical protein